MIGRKPWDETWTAHPGEAYEAAIVTTSNRQDALRKARGDRVIAIGSLFSGIGGLELGLELALHEAGIAHRVAWQVERDAWCRGVLAMHWPDAAMHRDVRSVGAHNLEPVDLMCGGFPCQDISAAGKRAGIDGARSGLWMEYARIIDECQPQIVVVENVARLVASGLDRVVGDLGELGYRVEARIISAADVGAPHIRERLFVAAHRRDDGRKERGARDHDDGNYARWDEPHRRHSAMAYADSGGLRDAQQRRSGRRSRRVRDEGCAELVDDGSPRGPRVSAQSGLGRDAHGLPDWLDRWPARPGDAPAIWEPPRATTLASPTRALRLAALGNAVVPRVALEVGRRVVELMVA